MTTIKTQIPTSFENYSPKNTKFVPDNNISPKHYMVRNWIFPFENNPVSDLTDEEIEYSRIKAELEANLADAIGRVAEIYGIEENELRYMFPVILRMLKSDSEWSK